MGTSHLARVGSQPLCAGTVPPLCQIGGGTSQPPPVNATRALGGSDGEGQQVGSCCSVQHPGVLCSTQSLPEAGTWGWQPHRVAVGGILPMVFLAILSRFLGRHRLR